MPEGRHSRGAFTGIVPQIVADKVPNIFHFIEVFNLFFVLLCFFCQIARGRRPTLSRTLDPTLIPTLAQAKSPTRARLSRAIR